MTRPASSTERRDKWAVPIDLRDPPTILIWGTYDLGKPRTRILRDGLKAIGCDVIEVHVDVWAGNEDKSQLPHRVMVRRLLRVVMAYPRLAWRFLRAPDHDVVLVPYLGQFDVIVLWPLARLRRTPVVWDMFLSLYDTVVNDRKLATAGSLTGMGLKLLERLGIRAADLVLLDTPAHARHIARLFDLPPGKTASVPVGAEPTAFPRLSRSRQVLGPTRLLFYGQMIPLHGVDTILAAAMSPRGRRLRWRLIGTGQDIAKVTAAVSRDGAEHIDWLPWVPYAELSNEIERADICLGIFGKSEKAASVVPNKVYQVLLSGRSLITRDSPAMREAFGGEHPGLRLVPAGSPDALLDAVEAFEREGFPVVSAEGVVVDGPESVARCFAEAVQGIC